MPDRDNQRATRARNFMAVRHAMPGMRFPVARAAMPRLRNTRTEPRSRKGRCANPCRRSARATARPVRSHEARCASALAGAPANARNDAHECGIPRNRSASALKSSPPRSTAPYEEIRSAKRDRHGMRGAENGIFRTYPIWERSHLSQNCAVGSAHPVADHSATFSNHAASRRALLAGIARSARAIFRQSDFSAPDDARGSTSPANAY